MQEAVPASGGSIDVAARVEGQRFNRFLLRTVVLCLAVLIVDGYDVMVMGFVAPSLARSFGVSSAALTPVFVLGQVGLAIGAFTAGPLADRIGRRRVILFAGAFFTVCTLLTLLTGSVLQLAVLRVVTGIGLGGILPNTIALVSEMSPRRNRAITVMVMFSGFSIGSAVAGLVSARLLEPYGWRGPVLLGGLVPLVLLPMVYVWLPESVRLLTLWGGRDREVASLLGRMGLLGRGEAGARFVTGEAPVAAKPVRALFTDRRGPMTALLWLTFFVNLLDLNLLAAWLPTYLNRFAGLTPGQAAGLASFYQIGGTVGTYLLGLIVDRVGASRAISAGYLLAALSIGSIGLIDRSPLVMTVALTLAGWFVVGGQGGINAYAGSLYPTAIRSTGVAWAFGIGRFGAMLGPALGGWMLAENLGAEPTFVIAALPITVAIVSVLLVGVFARRTA